MTRFLCAIAAVLCLMICWKTWHVHQAWNFLDQKSFAQSFGAPPETAKVTVVAFMNYTSRPSKEINPTIMALIENQPDTRIIFHIVPSASLPSLRNAQVALAAAMQKKFPEMHDELMRNEKPLTDVYIRELAEKLKLDPDRLLQDMNSDEVKGRMNAELSAFRILDIRMTPQFVFNRKWLYGPNTIEGVYSDFNTLIKQARGS